eukprot:843643-Pelagomonas_calceolata.AAC.4
MGLVRATHAAVLMQQVVQAAEVRAGVGAAGMCGRGRLGGRLQRQTDWCPKRLQVGAEDWVGHATEHEPLHLHKRDKDKRLLQFVAVPFKAIKNIAEERCKGGKRRAL